MRRTICLVSIICLAAINAGCASEGASTAATRRLPTTTSTVVLVEQAGDNARTLIVNGYTILPNAKLGSAELNLANLRDANLAGADLSSALLNTACLAGANLVAARLNGASMYRASLVGADLREANLSGANLAGAEMVGADLRNSDLSGANLRQANLINADLRNADLNGASLVNIYWDSTTKWPRGFSAPPSA